MMNQQLHFPSLEEAYRFALDHHARGEAQLAADIYARLLPETREGEPRAELQRLLGLALTQSGRVQDGLPHLEAAAAALPGSSYAQLHYGIALYELGRHGEAIATFERAHHLNPREPAALVNWSAALIAMARPAEAISIAERAVAIAPASAEARHNLGLALLECNRDQDALPQLREAIRLQPSFPDAWMHLGLVHRHLGMVDDALVCYREALRQKPDDANCAVNLADLWTAIGMSTEAEDLYRQVLQRHPAHTGARLGLAALIADAGREVDALPLLEDVEIPARRAEQVRLQKLSLLLAVDRKEEAMALLAEIEDRGVPYQRACFALLEKDDPKRLAAAEAVESALAGHADTPYLEQVRAHFTLADFWHEQKDYDRAFAHYAEGHALMRQHEIFQPDVHRAQMNRIIRHFSAERLAQGPFGCADPLPVFIVGMPRSGTSLLEQILDSHSQVHGAGERTEIPQIMTRYMEEVLDAPIPRLWDAKTLQGIASQHLALLRSLAPKVRHVTDKLPANFINVGLIALLFPQAKILYTVRDPMDNCLSIFQNNFRGRHTYQHDMNSLAFYYREQERLMVHWKAVLGDRILTVSYEDLVADFENQTRRVLDFLGLPWEEACLRFHENRRIVHTASKEQVNKPLYNTSVQRWRRYEPHLHGLAAALGMEIKPPRG